MKGSNDICDKCRSLNLDVVIREAQGGGYSFYGKQITAPWEHAELNQWVRVLRTRVGFRYRQQQYDCALCRALGASRVTQTHSNYQDGGDEIWVDYYNDCFSNQLNKARKKALRLMLVAQGSDMRHRYSINLSGRLVLLDSSTDPQIFSPQPISPSFDPNLVLSWLDYCTRHHRLLCHSKVLPVNGVKVIDCTTLQSPASISRPTRRRDNNARPNGPPYSDFKVSLVYPWLDVSRSSPEPPPTCLH